MVSYQADSDCWDLITTITLIQSSGIKCYLKHWKMWTPKQCLFPDRMSVFIIKSSQTSLSTVITILYTQLKIVVNEKSVQGMWDIINNKIDSKDIISGHSMLFILIFFLSNRNKASACTFKTQQIKPNLHHGFVARYPWGR